MVEMKVIHVNLIGENIKKIMFYWRIKFERQVRKKTVVRLSIETERKERRKVGYIGKVFKNGPSKVF